MNPVLQSSLKEYHPFKQNMLTGHSKIYSTSSVSKTITKPHKPTKKYHSFDTIKKK